MLDKLVYAGIGSRVITKEQFNFCRNVSRELAFQGWVLRSGGASGADTAFEEGCDEAKGEKEIYLPWKAFNDNVSSLNNPSLEAYDVARKFHPNYNVLTPGAIKLMARNSHQILGLDMNHPCNIVVYCAEEQVKGTVKGGTSQAIRIAVSLKIPMINLYYSCTNPLSFIINSIKSMVYINEYL